MTEKSQDKPKFSATAVYRNQDGRPIDSRRENSIRWRINIHKRRKPKWVVAKVQTQPVMAIGKNQGAVLIFKTGGA